MKHKLANMLKNADKMVFLNEYFVNFKFSYEDKTLRVGYCVNPINKDMYAIIFDIYKDDEEYFLYFNTKKYKNLIKDIENGNAKSMEHDIEQFLSDAINSSEIKTLIKHVSLDEAREIFGYSGADIDKQIDAVYRYRERPAKDN